jgi:hypothetical protein
MAYDPNATARKTSDQIGLQTLDLSQRDAYFQKLQAEGYHLVGNPIQFPGSSDPNTLRYWAKEYAVTVNGEFIVEISDPTYSQEPSNTLVYFIWSKQSASSPAAPQQAAAPATGGAPAAPAYPNPTAVLEQLLARLAALLTNYANKFTFQDTGGLLYPFITIGEHSYEHIGGRIMNLYLVKDGIHDYKILGNESHSQSSSRLQPMRDEMFSIKTLGKSSYFIMDEFKVLDQTQQNQIIYALQNFLTRY